MVMMEKQTFTRISCSGFSMTFFKHWIGMPTQVPKHAATFLGSVIDTIFLTHVRQKWWPQGTIPTYA